MLPVETSCEAVKVKLISILVFIGKMAARKDNGLEILRFASLFNYRYLDNTNGGSRKMIKLALDQVYVM